MSVLNDFDDQFEIRLFKIPQHPTVPSLLLSSHLSSSGQLHFHWFHFFLNHLDFVLWMLTSTFFPFLVLFKDKKHI